MKVDDAGHKPSNPLPQGGWIPWVAAGRMHLCMPNYWDNLLLEFAY